MSRCRAMTLEGCQCRQRATRDGDGRCWTHSRPPLAPRVFVITRNLKPYERLEGGGFRRHLIGKTFETPADADAWLREHWGEVSRSRPGRRFVSAAIEAIRV